MPLRPPRPPRRPIRHHPWVYHAGATARGVVNKGGQSVVRSADRASQDFVTSGINFLVDALGQLGIVTLATILVIFILLFRITDAIADSGTSLFRMTAQVLGIPTMILDRMIPDMGAAGDMSDLGEKVQLGQVFTQFDGTPISVNSGWGPRNTGIPGASTFHKGIDLPLAGGYPLLTWAPTQVTCSSSAGYGENGLATLKLTNGQTYQAGHLSACHPGTYGPGQNYGAVGSKGVSSGNHLHWIQKNSVGQLVHPQTHPLQATLTGKWPGSTAGGISGVDIDFIKGLEGFHPTAYVDGTEGGQTRWSWGYGTKAPGPGQTISQEAAHNEMADYLAANCLPIIPESLSPGQRTAAASLCYNIGPGVKDLSIWREIERGGNPNFLGFTRNTAGADLRPRRQKEQVMWSRR